jgi:tetratricopeptide (TPR) repeat protein
MYPDKFPNSRDTWAKTLAPKDGKPLPLHHYCYGLNFLNRAKKKTRNPEERGGDLTDASNLVGDVMNARDDYILKPDFYLAKGEILLLQGKKVDAEFNFRRATEIRPAYPKGWLALSDLLVQTGRRDQAREALEKGLNAAPDKYKDYMKKRLAELDAGAGQSAGGEPTTAGSVGSSPTR